MTDDTTPNVKPDAMNAAAVLLLQSFLDEIASGDAVVTKLGGEDTEDNWTLSVSLLRNMPGTPKEAPAPARPTHNVKACFMCKQNTYDVEKRVCLRCNESED